MVEGERGRLRLIEQRERVRLEAMPVNMLGESNGGVAATGVCLVMWTDGTDRETHLWLILEKNGRKKNRIIDKNTILLSTERCAMIRQLMRSLSPQHPTHPLRRSLCERLCLEAEKVLWIEIRWTAFCAWSCGKASEKETCKRSYWKNICLIEPFFFYSSPNHVCYELTSQWIISDKGTSANKPHPVPVESLPPAMANVITRLVRVLQKIWIMLLSVFSYCRFPLQKCWVHIPSSLLTL